MPAYYSASNSLSNQHYQLAWSAPQTQSTSHPRCQSCRCHEIQVRHSSQHNNFLRWWCMGKPTILQEQNLFLVSIYFNERIFPSSTKTCENKIRDLHTIISLRLESQLSFRFWERNITCHIISIENLLFGLEIKNRTIIERKHLSQFHRSALIFNSICI